MILIDTQKAAELFAKFDVPICGYIVNRVHAPRTLDSQNIPEYLRNRLRDAAGPTWTRSTSCFGEQVLARVPELERDITGLPMIEKMAEAMFGPSRRQAPCRSIRSMIHGREQSMQGLRSRRHPNLKYHLLRRQRRGGQDGAGRSGGRLAWPSGQATLLASTNPVHSLSGLLDQNVFGQADPGHRRRQPVGLRDRHQRHHRELQAGNPREDRAGS